MEKFVDKGDKENVVIEQIQKVEQLDRKQLPHPQNRNDKQFAPLSVTYSRGLPNLQVVLIKH